jgi:hypothetical protein
VSAKETILQLGFVMIALGAAIAVVALFPRVGPWRPPPIAEAEPPLNRKEATARRKAVRPRKKAPSAPAKAARYKTKTRQRGTNKAS